jgi:hypothetical protein
VSVLKARHRARVATPRLRDGEMRLRDAEMGLGLRTQPGRRALLRGRPGRGVVEEAPAVAAARVSDGDEERERLRGEGENEWVGGISGISHPAPALCACGGWANDVHELATRSMTCGSQLAWAHTSTTEGYRLNVSRHAMVGGFSRLTDRWAG